MLKTGRAKAIRFSTLERLCEVLECRPWDLLAYKQRAATNLATEEPEAVFFP
jgi:putative transcriptional regulator